MLFPTASSRASGLLSLHLSSCPPTVPVHGWIHNDVNWKENGKRMFRSTPLLLYYSHELGHQPPRITGPSAVFAFMLAGARREGSSPCLTLDFFQFLRLATQHSPQCARPAGHGRTYSQHGRHSEIVVCLSSLVHAKSPSTAPTNPICQSQEAARSPSKGCKSALNGSSTQKPRGQESDVMHNVL